MTPAQQEREAVVAWLNELALLDRPLRLCHGDSPHAVIEAVADAIERGEHRKGK